jgi:hypothetical protein
VRVIVLGGAGNFGARIARALRGDPTIGLLVAGRLAVSRGSVGREFESIGWSVRCERGSKGRYASQCGGKSERWRRPCATYLATHRTGDVRS